MRTPAVGDEGVLALVRDSTNVFVEGEAVGSGAAQSLTRLLKMRGALLQTSPATWAVATTTGLRSKPGVTLRWSPIAVSRRYRARMRLSGRY